MTARRANRLDANQHQIVEALERHGFEVQSLAAVGNGVADLLVAKGERLWLLEVKSQHGKLEPDQVTWHRRFPVYIVRSADQALRAVGVLWSSLEEARKEVISMAKTGKKGKGGKKGC